MIQNVLDFEQYLDEHDWSAQFGLYVMTKGATFVTRVTRNMFSRLRQDYAALEAAIMADALALDGGRIGTPPPPDLPMMVCVRILAEAVDKLAEAADEREYMIDESAGNSMTAIAFGLADACMRGGGTTPEQAKAVHLVIGATSVTSGKNITKTVRVSSRTALLPDLEYDGPEEVVHEGQHRMVSWSVH